jgi:hypothetical protein
VQPRAGLRTRPAQRETMRTEVQFLKAKNQVHAAIKFCAILRIVE